MRGVVARSEVARQRALPKATAVLLAVAGCSTGAPSGMADAGTVAGDPDAAVVAPRPDAGAGAADAAAGSADAAPPGPYRHTIDVDGTSSFTGDEIFATTTDSYSAYVTWDDQRLYLGYLGDDVAADDPRKWFFVYLDVAPGGSATGHRYNTQTPSFPAGFRADHYYRWQSSGAVEDLMTWSGSAWQTAASVAPESARGGPLLEVSLPFADLGDPPRLGVVVLWINESDGLEAAYGGLYADSFTDGYHASIPVGRYLEVDRTSALPPNDPANRHP